MSEQLTARFRTALKTEVDVWKSDGLVSDEIAAGILSRYPVPTKKAGLIAGITILGAILIGLGTLLYIGANWGVIPKLLKLTLILAAIAASYGSGWFCFHEPGRRPHLGAALLLLGNLFYGAGIWLVSQIFQTDMSLESGLLLWGIGSAGMTLVTRQTALATLSSVIFSIWVFASQFESTFNSRFATDTHGNLATFALGIGASLVLSYVARSRASAIVTLVAGSIWVTFCSDVNIYGLAAYGACLFLAHVWHRKQLPLFSNTFMYAGALILSLAYFMITFDHQGIFQSLQSFKPVNLAVLTVVAVALAALVSMRDKMATGELWLGFGAALAACLLTVIPESFARVVVTNFAFVVLLASMITVGVRVNRPGLVNVALVFVVLDIVARYFDFFFSMMDRSLFFVLGGVVLLVAGALVEKNRQRLFQHRTA